MKEILFKAFKIAAIAVAIGQLALSQIHIGIITKVFAPPVGFFLFAFITFGVVMAFNAVSYKHGSNPVILLLGGIASSAGGIIYLNYLFADLRAGNLLTFAEARLSIVISIIAIAAYASSTIVLLVTSNYDD